MATGGAHFLVFHAGDKHEQNQFIRHKIH